MEEYNFKNLSKGKWLSSNAIKDFYIEMFHVEIKELLKKKNKENSDGLSFTSSIIPLPEFIIIIEDHNKKIFKKKILNVKMDTFYSTMSDYNENIYADIWKAIDKRVFEYCDKRYFKKLKNEDLNEFLDKYEKISRKYNENYEDNPENFKNDIQCDWNI